MVTEGTGEYIMPVQVTSNRERKKEREREREREREKECFFVPLGYN